MRSHHTNWLNIILLGVISVVHYPILIDSHGDHVHWPTDRRLLVISMDGFRPDYLQRLREHTDKENVTNYFDQLIENGVHAPNGIHNVFTTSTFPNHYSIVTGLYEESHGIVGNLFWDPKINKTVLYPRNAKYYGGHPIWNLYARQRDRAKVACQGWVGCGLNISNYSIPASVPYIENISCDDQIQILVNWLRADVQLMLMYINQPDKAGHQYGPLSDEIPKVLLELNTCLGHVLATLESMSFWPDNCEILIVSDHGMQTINRTVHVPRNDQLYTIRSLTYILAQIDPLPGKEEEAMAALQAIDGSTAYRKQDIPERWHYKNNDLIREIMVVADGGVALSSDDQPTKMKGGHGYDTRDPLMRPMFIASGRAFKRGYEIVEGTFWTIDIYLLMCALMSLAPTPNNATWAHLVPILDDKLVSAVKKTVTSNEEWFDDKDGHDEQHSMLNGNVLIVFGTSVTVVLFAITLIILSAYSRRRAAKLRTTKRLVLAENHVLLEYRSSNESDNDECDTFLTTPQPPGVNRNNNNNNNSNKNCPS